MTAAANRFGPANSREELRLASAASGLLMLLDAYRLTGRLPLDVQVQASRLRHAVKLTIQAEAFPTRQAPSAPVASVDPAAVALRAWIASQPWVQPGPVGWVYLTLFWSSTGRVALPAGWGYRQQDVVDLAGDEPLEAAEPSTSARSTTGCCRRPTAADSSPRSHARPAGPWPRAARSAWPIPAAQPSPPAPNATKPRRRCGRLASPPRRGGEGHGRRRPPGRLSVVRGVGACLRQAEPAPTLTTRRKEPAWAVVQP